MYVVYITFQAGRPSRVGPYAGPGRGIFYKLRVARSDVVSLSLSRRYAASESAKKPWLVARGSWFEKRTIIPNGLWSNITAGRPLGRPLRTTNSFPHELRTTNNEQQKNTSRRPTYPAESRVSLSGCILSHHQVTRFGISDSHGFARRKAPSKPVPCLSQGTLVG